MRRNILSLLNIRPSLRSHPLNSIRSRLNSVGSLPMNSIGARSVKSAALVLISALLLLMSAQGQDIASFEKRTTVKVLPNGLTVIVCERPEAPVFSFFTMVDVGSSNDPMGESGLAHMFEHMAFKGTDKIGTTNFA